MFSSCQYGSIERVHVTDVHGAGIAINAVASGTTEQIRVNDCRISDISKWNSSIGSGRGITFWAFISSDTNNNNIVHIDDRYNYHLNMDPIQYYIHH